MRYCIFSTMLGCLVTLEERYILRGYDETEGKSPDITLLNAPNYPGPLLLDISLVQSFPGSQDPSRPLPITDYLPSQLLYDSHWLLGCHLPTFSRPS